MKAADRERAVNVHLPGACRKRRRVAESTDPRATSCRSCIGSRKWRRAARRAINQSNLT